MIKKLFLLFIFSGFLFSNLNAQSSTTFTTKFIPHSVTYNGSDKPSQCWESVAWGILIEDGERTYFFSLPSQDLESLKETIGDQEITVEVIFYEEYDAESGEDGNVVLITLNGVVVFDQP